MRALSDDERNTIIIRLEQSSLAQGPAAAVALRERPATKSLNSSMPCKQFLGIYSTRLAHLEAKKGTHAIQLRSSVAEFVSELRDRAQQNIGDMVRIESGEEHTYLVFLAEDGEAIACMKVVSKMDVTPARWDQLWSAR